MFSLARPAHAVAALAVTLAVPIAGCGSSSDSSTGTTNSPAASSPAAATPSTSTPAAAATPVKGGIVKVAYRGYAIDPDKVSVNAGQKIEWTSYDDTVHNVVFKDGSPAKFKSKDMKKGDVVTFAPKKPGTYSYLCEYHPASMQGTITVK